MVNPGFSCLLILEGVTRMSSMDADEREIYYYLKPRRTEFTCLRDICRSAGNKKRARYNPDWAVPALGRMVDRGILNFDGKDGYRLRPRPESEVKGKVWASPAMKKILQDSGKEFDTVRLTNNEDEYYDKL
jgi:hypothetical protein